MHTPLPLRDLWARQIVCETVAADIGNLMSGDDAKSRRMQTALEALLAGQGPGPNLGETHSLGPDTKVCIVGAGIAGLYIALILDDLKIPNLSYEILEADSRTGGRVYTHRFSTQPNDYYDVGAMRFPQIASMERVFDLARRVNVPLTKYYLHGENCPSLFNDICLIGDSTSTADPFRVGQAHGGRVPDRVAANATLLLEDTFRQYKMELHRDFSVGFQRLLKADMFSTREVLRKGIPGVGAEKFDFASIQWMETLNTATGLFNQSFTESIMDSFEFDNPLGDVEWFCVSGGSSMLTDRMVDAIEGSRTRIQLGKEVTSVSVDGQGLLAVQCVGEKSARSGYATVFATAPLGCLQRMDLSTLGLHPCQRDALRCLHYDMSVKVGIEFRRAWWTTNCNIRSGGEAASDLPSRTCVYPSYGLDGDPDQPAVLLASYTWAQDAARIAALIDPREPKGPNSRLMRLVLGDLARLHHPNITLDEIQDLYLDHHAFSWTNAPFSCGAFAMFGPGQFSNLYPYLIRPAADGKFHIVGEAASAHHGWLVGALNSAYMAVYKFLFRYKLWEYIEKLERNWGTVFEMDTHDGYFHLQNALGRLSSAAGDI
ncbi:hypothetical protein CDV55_103203 [Aspergillus turcosus]|nr:hypothetical protein CDV55_103203 [Aspergillus turcosus]